ncbi:RluA family pseudouridine synthase [Acholeplasma equirhinis]|uniref:RluA family pseudouridine synthase n=1 Tax=Acholeplasma equirhinis TaxID=555393 RepID=UPI00197AEF2D|nr:RluA family pseudouridine synthase [Acholeplasma equirhinis]MBN3490333.1 RluA family pseudouridine synthase [Acholeplasma equirhinis]
MLYLSLKPSQEYNGKSIREYLQSLHVGKAVIYQYSSTKRILIGDKPVNSEYRLKPNDEITLELEEDPDQIRIDEAIDVIFEDGDFFVVEKPIDLLVHTDGNELDTLNSRVANYFHEKDYYHPVLPVHRIDKATSGLVLYAKHFVALAYLSYQFETKEIHKVYEALVAGQVMPGKGKINQPLEMDKSNKMMIISPKGKPALTIYEVNTYKENNSLLEISIESGRTHQIRAHLASIGHPVLGDPIYGKYKYIRLMLHFKSITFTHFRENKKVTFTSKVPF